MNYLPFCIRIILYSILFPRIFHVVLCIDILLFLRCRLHFIYSFICQWTVGFFSTLGLSWIMLLYRYMCESYFQFLLHILWVELLCHMGILCLTFCRTSKLSSQVTDSFYIPSAVQKGSISPSSRKQLFKRTFKQVFWYIPVVCS